MKLVRYADRPDLREIRVERLSKRTFPEFMHHNESGGRYWGRLYDEQPDFQLALVDGDEPVAELHSLPLAWDGSVDDLPAGWDDAFIRAFESGRPADALAALAISVARSAGRAILDPHARGDARGGSGPWAPLPHRTGAADGRSRTTRSSRSSATWSGGEPTARTSIPGSASTSGSAAS